MKMGLEVSRILALAEGSFHIRNMKKATLGMRSTRSQNRTLRRESQKYIHVILPGKLTQNTFSFTATTWGIVTG
jgi:hypothetical protein